MRRSAYVLAGCLALTVLTGCEALQKKFTRKPKHPAAAPSPIIQFQDYSRAMTPAERYRKHYMMFDYWNHELLEGLQLPPLNPKRYRNASSEALTELKTLQGLLKDDAAARLAPLVEERAKITERLSGTISDVQAPSILRDIESQMRGVHRDFAPNDVRKDLKEDAPATEPGTPPEAGSATGAPHTEAVRPDDARSD